MNAGMLVFVAYLFEYNLSFLDDDVMKNMNNFHITEVQPQGVAYLLDIFFVNFSLALLIKVLLIKKSV